MTDCTDGFTVGNGTEMLRTNGACVTGFADIYLKWALETKQPLQSARNYPVTGTSGNCRKTGRRTTTFNSAVLSNYEYKYFTDKAHLLELVQYGPVVTSMDISEFFHVYAGGVFYDRNCFNNKDETVPPECRGSNGQGFTCLGDCKNKLPVHCDRYGVGEKDIGNFRWLFSRWFNYKRYTEDGLYFHAVLIVGYGTDRYKNTMSSKGA